MKKLIALLLAMVMVLSLAACGNNAPAETTEAPTAPAETEAPVVEAPATYTYNSALSEFPTNWNYHTYQTATDAEILDNISDGFYVFDYNETYDGYAMVPGMAVGEPEDVTAEYIGQYGLEEGAENRAYKITLRDDLKWEDGTPSPPTTSLSPSSVCWPPRLRTTALTPCTPAPLSSTTLRTT